MLAYTCERCAGLRELSAEEYKQARVPRYCEPCERLMFPDLGQAPDEQRYLFKAAHHLAGERTL